MSPTVYSDCGWLPFGWSKLEADTSTLSEFCDMSTTTFDNETKTCHGRPGNFGPSYACGQGTEPDENYLCNPVVTCDDSTAKVQDGMCVGNITSCDSETATLQNGTCVGKKCGEGTKLENNECVPNYPQISCGTGTKLDNANNQCVAIVSCDDSTTTTQDNICVGKVSCGEGTVPENDKCVRIEKYDSHVMYKNLLLQDAEETHRIIDKKTRGLCLQIKNIYGYNETIYKVRKLENCIPDAHTYFGIDETEENDGLVWCVPTKDDDGTELASEAFLTVNKTRCHDIDPNANFHLFKVGVSCKDRQYDVNDYDITAPFYNKSFAAGGACFYNPDAVPAEKNYFAE